jgi:hypothetical protein
MKTQALFIFLLLFLFSCGSADDTKISFLKDKSLKVSEKMELLMDSDYLKKLGLNKDEIVWVQEIYQKRNLKPFFANDSSLNKKGAAIEIWQKHPLYFGIPQKRLVKLKKINLHPLEKDILITLNNARILEDLNKGIFNFDSKTLKPKSLPTTETYIVTLKQLDTISIDRLFLKQGSLDTNYRFLAQHLYDYCLRYQIDTTNYHIKTRSEDSLSKFSAIQKALQGKRYLSPGDWDLKNGIAALKLFQTHNGLSPDGFLNSYTAKALNESTEHKVLRAMLSLDKLRQSKIHQEKYMRINIPEYRLYFYANDSLKSENRIVVGKVSNKTPELNSIVTQVIALPFWKVPSDIANHEVLPSVKNNSGYLAKHNYKIYKEKDVEIDPSTVVWKGKSNFPYMLIQQPGIDNSLGLIKFEFANKFNVYVHDTPSKTLFRNPVRSYSHGCMRCENPIELAKIVLDNDKIGKKRNVVTKDSLDSIISRGVNYPIALQRSFPIFVYYQTVVAYRDQLLFQLDIYDRDQEYLDLLNNY